MTFQFTKTNDSIVVIDEETGKPTTVREGMPNFKNLKAAIEEGVRTGNYDEARKHLSVSNSLDAWAKGFFKFTGGVISYKGETVPSQLADRMKAMAAKGESPEPLMRFWKKLQKNPSARSVEQLFPFLSHQGIPIIDNGNFLAYKGVKNNYTDGHSGCVDNKPGVVNEMPRNKISDDPNHACHYGYHVGALSYARRFSAITIVCEVDPTDVVCIPYDCGQQKMRVCKYRVIGNHNGEFLPSTSYELEKLIGDSGKVETGEKEEQEVVSDDESKVGLTAEEKKLIADGKPVLAAKAIRTRFNKGLEEAVKLVRQYQAELKKAPVKAQKQLKQRRGEEKRMVLKVPSQFRKLHKMQLRDLLKQPIEVLRTYAARVLAIVGASKIPGGKLALCNQIIKTRNNYR